MGCGEAFSSKKNFPLNSLKISPYLENVKKTLKKDAKKFGKKKKARTFATANGKRRFRRRAGRTAEKKEFFEEIYDIQQEKVRTQGKRPSIHNRMKEAWDREKTKLFIQRRV